MVRTFCDRCGRVVAGVSKLGSMTVRAENERGGEIVTLDFCAFCADWAIGTLMRRTMLGKDEEAQGRAMDKLEFDLTAGKLRKKGEKKGGGKDGVAWTADILRREEEAAVEPKTEQKPKLTVKGPGAAEKRAIFEKLLHYKEKTGTGWAGRIEKASGGAVGSETIRAIVVDGVVVDIATWRKIGKAIDAMKTAGVSAT